MAYELNFPQPTDYMRDSQPLMLINYAAIFNFIGADHAQFNTPNAGDHNQMTFPLLNEFPANNGNEMLFAGADDFTNNIMRLFIMNAAGVANSFDDRFITPLNQGLTNYIQLPSGIIFKWAFSNAGEISGVVTHEWDEPGIPGAFTTQLWATVFYINTGNGDIDRVSYVTDITNPNAVSFITWQRDSFNQLQTSLANTVVFAIGV